MTLILLSQKVNNSSENKFMLSLFYWKFKKKNRFLFLPNENLHFFYWNWFLQFSWFRTLIIQFMGAKGCAFLDQYGSYKKPKTFRFFFQLAIYPPQQASSSAKLPTISLVALATAETADFIHKKNKFKEHKETMKLNSLESSRESPVVLCASATATWSLNGLRSCPIFSSLYRINANSPQLKR